MRDILMIFFTVKPLRALAVVACLLTANIIEGVGLASLLPVISLAADQESSDSLAQEIVMQLMSGLGLAPALGPLLALTITALVLKSLIALVAHAYVGYTAAEVVTNLRRRIINNLLRVRWRYFVHQPSGRITNIISNDATRAADAYTLAATFVAMVGQTIVLTVIAFIVSFELALAAFAMGALMVAALHVLVRSAKRAGFAQTKRTGDLVVFLSDTLANLKLIRAMNRQAPFAGLLERKISKLRKALRRQVVSREAVSHLQDAVMAIFLGLGFYVLHLNFTVPLAELIVAGFVVSKSVSSIGKVQKAYQKAVLLESAFIAANRLISETEADPEPPRGTTVPTLIPSIRYRSVGFAYDAQPVLRDLDLEIQTGKLTVLMGPSGAGKSTIIDLLFGLYRPDSGTLSIGDHSIDDIDIKWWRDQLGYVPQDVILLHDTIRANLTLGDDGISDAQIWQTLDLAGVGNALRDLPAQLDTIVGERGARFSGGQRQRIALARALVRAPSLLVLDEVTSALDQQTAERVAHSIGQLLPEKTILAVTHRPEFAEIADRIYKIEGGRAEIINKMTV